MTPSTVRRVLLIGFMGAGKTHVGRELARRLGWRFVDFDRKIEEEVGAPVHEIFRDRGEAHFRVVEQRVAALWLTERDIVLASGGGWSAREQWRDDVPPATVSVWLRVSAEAAVRRASREPGARPLLDVSRPVERARELLSMREPFYGKADYMVDTEHSSVEDVSSRILEILARTDTQ